MESNFPTEATQSFKTPTLDISVPKNCLEEDNHWFDITQPFITTTAMSSASKSINDSCDQLETIFDDRLFGSTQAFAHVQTPEVETSLADEISSNTQAFQLEGLTDSQNENVQSDDIDETQNFQNQASVDASFENENNVNERDAVEEINNKTSTSDDENSDEQVTANFRKNRVLSSDDEAEISQTPIFDNSANLKSSIENDTAEIFENLGQDMEILDGDETEDKKSEVGELIADIFGESDEEAVADPVVNETEELQDNQIDNQSDHELYQNEEVDEDGDLRPSKIEDEKEEILSDFDLIMAKRKAENRKRRAKKRDYDFINNNDDLIIDLLKQMELAYKDDNESNSLKQPATKKRSLLKTIVTELKKADLVSTFIECGVISNMAEWLSLLPDKSLPSLEIRTEFLKLLLTFPTLDHQILRSSNIGKAVMLLLKHPKETKENKERAKKLINEWARPIFNLQTDYRSLSKDERMKRDYDHMPTSKKHRLSSDVEKQQNASTSEEKPVLGPGDKGFIGRARVPRPSSKDYVMRPKWNVETEFRNLKSKKQTTSEMDRKIREIKMRSSSKRATHAVAVSVEGRKMSL